MTDLLPELAMGSAETMRRLLEQPRKGALSPTQGRNLIRYSLHALHLIRDAWASVQMSLARGVEATAFEADCEQVTAALDHYLLASSLARQAVGEQPRSERRAHQLARLAKAEEEARRIRGAVQEALASSRRPPRPIDWDAVAEAEAAHARGEHRSIDQILSDSGPAGK